MSKFSNEEATTPMEVLSIGKELEDTNQDKLVDIITLQEGDRSSTFDPIRRIKDGFKFFKINEFDKHPDYYLKLAEKQEPKFLVFACSDSRVSPTNILNLRPGEVFMARNIANMVPTFNQVEVVMVIGHSRCGGIIRLISLPDEETSYDFIDDWVSIGLPAKAKVLAEHPNATSEELQTLIEKESVMNSLVNLLSYPYVRSGLAAKNLKLIGGHYDFVRGKFQIMEMDYDIKPTINI